MARNALDNWERLLSTTDELESPLEGSGIAAAPDEEDEVSDVDLAAPVPVGRGAVPAQGGEAPHRLPVPLPPARRAARRDFGGELADAQAKDKDEKRKAAFESGLDIMAFRKPFQPRDVGTPNADALLKRNALARQGKQDERQDRLDAQTEFLNDARVKAYLAKANAPTKPPKPDTHALKAADDEAAAKSLREVILKRYGPQLAKSNITPELINAMPKDAAEKLLQEMQSGRAVESGIYAREDSQDFTGKQREIDRGREEERQTRERTVNGRGLALDAASARTVREIDANTDNLEAAVTTLKRLHERYKGQPLSEVSDADGSIAAAVENAQSAYRVYANLGVPSGKDAEMSNAAVNDPSKFKALLLGRGPASWDVIIRSAKQQADAKARSYLAAPAASGVSGGATLKKAGRRITMKDGTVWEEQPDGSARQVK